MGDDDLIQAPFAGQPEGAVVVGEVAGQVVADRGEAGLLELPAEHCCGVAVREVGDHQWIKPSRPPSSASAVAVMSGVSTSWSRTSKVITLQSLSVHSQAPLLSPVVERGQLTLG